MTSVRSEATQFLSCDWGSSTFRLRLANRMGEVQAAVKSDAGASQWREDAPHARAERFYDCLRTHIARLAEAAGRNLAGLPVVISGMATSTHGWQEVPYAPLPCRLDGRDLGCIRHTLEDGRAALFVGGIRSDRDVMRGEECELLGLFHAYSHDDLRENCTVILPGTHAKHVRICQGTIAAFRTCMTGEVYGLLARHSVLARSLEIPRSDAPLSEAFEEGLATCRAEPLIAALFQVRARALLAHLAPSAAGEFLSGLLIGYECLALADWAGTGPVLLAAGEALARRYARGLRGTSLSGRVKTVDSATVERSVPLAHALLLHGHEERGI